MSKEIWKFIIQPDGCTIDIPPDAEILTAQAQGVDVCIWALVRPVDRRIRRSFIMFGTGHPIPEDKKLKYINTVMFHGGQFVLHVFEEL